MLLQNTAVYSNRGNYFKKECKTCFILIPLLVRLSNVFLKQVTTNSEIEKNI